MPEQPQLNDEDRENLVAYLDGELDEASAQALESKLSLDPVSRAEADALRSRRRKPVVPLPAQESGPLGPRPAEQIVPDRGQPPSHRLAQEELAAVIQAALEGLNERQRMAVVLNKFEDMNYAEIAEVMGLTTKAVKSLLSRARMNLRAALVDYIYMDGQPVPEAPEE